MCVIDFKNTLVRRDYLKWGELKSNSNMVDRVRLEPSTILQLPYTLEFQAVNVCLSVPFVAFSCSLKLKKREHTREKMPRIFKIHYL